LFQSLAALKSVDMSNVKVENLTGMYGMFMSSSNVETVNFSGLDISKVKNMGYIFQNAYKLREII
jgi:surface protein